MKEQMESFGVLVLKTGGLALLVIYPLIPLIIAYLGLQAVGRSLWSAGTRRKRQKFLQQVFDAPRTPGDQYYRDLAMKLK